MSEFSIMNILFVCKYNRYRSRVAEALFNHYNKNPKNIAKSAGTFVTEKGFPIISMAASALKKMGIEYDISQGAVQLNSTTTKWADKIVIVAEEVDEKDFPIEKTIKIGFPDVYSSDKETEENIKRIEKEVLKLVAEIS